MINANLLLVYLSSKINKYKFIINDLLSINEYEFIINYLVFLTESV